MADLQPRARHVPVEQRAEVVLFAGELKRLFDSIGMSLGAFCAGSPIDKGTLSRYLNGKRVPQGSWLLERLFALYAESGDPLTEEVRAHLVALQLAALEVAHPHEYKVRIATDELGHARIAIRESARHIAFLEGELAERTRLLNEATSTIQHLRDAWDTERLTAQHEITSLRGEIDDLTAQIRLAYDNHDRAVTRQQELQQLLERLDSDRDHAASGSRAEQTTGVRVANAIEALASEDPDHRTAAIEALGEINNQSPAFREAIKGYLVSVIRDQSRKAALPSYLPAPCDQQFKRTQATLDALRSAKLLDLSRANLTGADLSRMNLTGADLTGADLSRMNLTGADLTGATLTGATLTDATLTGADLTGATLTGATLRDANLNEANLNEANLNEANLNRANLNRANLNHANLSYADLNHANLGYANLDYAELSGVDLRGANLRGADLSDADLSDADLSGADLSGADPRGLVWSEQTVWPSSELERWLRASGRSPNADGRLKAGSYYGGFPDDLTGGRPVT